MDWTGPWHRRANQGAWVIVALLMAWSLYIALNRIYQVDEAQNLYMCRIVAMGRQTEYFSNAALFFFGPLRWLAARASSSALLFSQVRTLFWGLFWVNLLLAWKGSGGRFRSGDGGIRMLFLATLAPWWDYGFEIRHDNLILTGVLLSWWLLRRQGRGTAWACGFVGFLSALLQFTAFKAFVFWIPLGLGLTLFSQKAREAGRGYSFGAWAGGLGLGFLICYAFYRHAGLWPTYLAGLAGGGSPTPEARFWPWLALGRLFDQTPLLLAGGLALAAWWWRSFRLRLPEAWEGGTGFPELALAFLGLAVLFVNPTPFPYNLVLFVPFLGMAVLRFWDLGKQEIGSAGTLGAWVLGLAVFAHGAPFLKATSRHQDWTNERQEALMELAETMTDPGKDRVFDASGLVVTRWSIGYHWYLHSLNMKEFRSGTRDGVGVMMKKNPPSVLLMNYRTDWLDPKDMAFIKANYLPLADDFWVLGAVLPVGKTSWSCLHEGRYLILSLDREGRPVRNSGPVLVDGVNQVGPTLLMAGEHSVVIPNDFRVGLIWLGPQLTDLPTLPPGRHERLFVNWY